MEKLEPKRDEGSQRSTYKHTYFLSAIPTVFDGYLSSTEIFQYTVSEYTKESPENAIVFITELVPTTIHYFKESQGVLGLIMQLFSIIGGLYMIAKVLDIYIAALFVKQAEFSEINPGSELF